jgi:uncharacterized protein (DUF3084 family)
MPQLNDTQVEQPVREKTIDEKVNESYIKVGELVVKYAKVEQDAQDLQAKAQELQQELRSKVDQLRKELKLREGTKLSANAS